MFNEEGPLIVGSGPSTRSRGLSAMMAAAAMMAATSTNQGIALTVVDEPRRDRSMGFAHPYGLYRDRRSRRQRREAFVQAKNNPAGTKLLKKAAKGRIGIR
jgi:hypothetical protein